MTNKMDWVDDIAKKQEEDSEKGYFKFVEGDNRVQLLTYSAQLIQRWTGKGYEVLLEGDSQEGKQVKGVCYVLQDGEIKLAFLPYTVLKQIRELQNDPDWSFDEFPMPRTLNLRAKGAGTKEVEYSVIPSPKEAPVSPEVLLKLKEKQTPEEIVEKMKEKRSAKATTYPENEDGEKPPF